MGSSSADRDGLRCLFGRIALGWGYVTAEQIEECVDEQEQARATQAQDEKVKIPPLGELLVDKGYMSREECEEVLMFQEASLRKKVKDGESSLGEMLMGQVALQEGLIERWQLEGALSIQAREIEEGKYRRLGKIMMDMGYLQPEDILTLLGRQDRTLVICTTCQTKYNAEGYSEDKHFICKRCGSTLEVCKDREEVVADETLAFEILLPQSEENAGEEGDSDGHWYKKDKDE